MAVVKLQPLRAVVGADIDPTFTFTLNNKTMAVDEKSNAIYEYDSSNGWKHQATLTQQFPLHTAFVYVPYHKGLAHQIWSFTQKEDPGTGCVDDSGGDFFLTKFRVDDGTVIGQAARLRNGAFAVDRRHGQEQWYMGMKYAVLARDGIHIVQNGGEHLLTMIHTHVDLCSEAIVDQREIRFRRLRERRSNKRMFYPLSDSMFYVHFTSIVCFTFLCIQTVVQVASSELKPSLRPIMACWCSFSAPTRVFAQTASSNSSTAMEGGCTKSLFKV